MNIGTIIEKIKSVHIGIWITLGAALVWMFAFGGIGWIHKAWTGGYRNFVALAAGDMLTQQREAYEAQIKELTKTNKALVDKTRTLNASIAKLKKEKADVQKPKNRKELTDMLDTLGYPVLP
jgi:hypothetical protein